MAKLKIGITGNIGTGKSTFCSFLKEQGFNIIDADSEAKLVLNSDEKVKNEIIRLFGKESYIENEPNIKFLAEKVFNSQENVKKMNKIVHPATIKNINKKMELELKNRNIVFVESALIFEAGIDELFNYIILITAEDSKKIERVVERDGVDEEEVRRRLENQLSESFKKENSDFTIENNGDIKGFISKSELILNIIRTISENEALANLELD